MKHDVTIFTGQWADLPLEEVAKIMSDFGYDGLEVACWGGHFDPIIGAESKDYCEDKVALLDKYNLKLQSLSTHTAGQLVGDNYDARHDNFAPENLRGNAKGMREWAIKHMKCAAKSAANLNIPNVNGFFGSPIWSILYSFPPCTPNQIDDGFKLIAERWLPILDVFADNGVKYAFEVHPAEIAFDIASAQRLLETLGHHKAFGFNYDPSHFAYQGVDYILFLNTFKDLIINVHIKDVWWGHGDGTVGVYGGHTNFGDTRRYWDFRTPGRGDVKFEDIMVTLNNINYTGPLSVEWEDVHMDRLNGAKEAVEFVRKLDFPPSQIDFDAGYSK